MLVDQLQSRDIVLAPFDFDKDGTPNKPNPTQQRVLEWVDKKRAEENRDKIYVLYLQGGVGCGKSRGVLAPALECLCEIPGLRVLWGREDLIDVELSVKDKFFEIIDHDLIAKKNEQYNWCDIRQLGGTLSRLFFRGLKDVSSLGSQEFGLIIVTEVNEITEQMYRALKRRCRQACGPNIILMESEPPREDHWLCQLTDPQNEKYDPDIEKWELSTYENAENLPESYMGSLEGMPDAWKKRFLHGKAGFTPDGDPFYDGFYEDIHITDLEYDSRLPLILSWDFGFRHPNCLISQLDLLGRLNILENILGTNITIKKFIDFKVVPILNERYKDPIKIKNYGDPACHQVSEHSEQTSWKIASDRGFVIVCKQSTYRERKEIMEHRLSTSIKGRPGIQVNRKRCDIIVEGFLGGYHYPNKKEGQEFNKRDETPFKDGYYEHPMNSLEYILVNLFSAVRSRKKKKPKRRATSDNI